MFVGVGGGEVNSVYGPGVYVDMTCVGMLTKVWCGGGGLIACMGLVRMLT